MGLWLERKGVLCLEISLISLLEMESADSSAWRPHHRLCRFDSEQPMEEDHDELISSSKHKHKGWSNYNHESDQSSKHRDLENIRPPTMASIACPSSSLYVKHIVQEARWRASEATCAPLAPLELLEDVVPLHMRGRLGILRNLSAAFPSIDLSGAALNQNWTLVFAIYLESSCQSHRCSLLHRVANGSFETPTLFLSNPAGRSFGRHVSAQVRPT